MSKRTKKKIKNRQRTQTAARPAAAQREVTVNGIALKIDPAVFDDYELLADLNEIDEGNPLRIIPAFKRIMGGRYKEVLEAMRDPDTGIVKASDASMLFIDLIKSMSPNS